MVMGVDLVSVGDRAAHPNNVTLQPGPGQDKLG